MLIHNFSFLYVLFFVCLPVFLLFTCIMDVAKQINLLMDVKVRLKTIIISCALELEYKLASTII